MAFEACSARPASKVLRWTLAGYSGLVVRRLPRGKYIILCESRAQRASNRASLSDGILNLATAFLQWISVALKKYGSCGFRTELGKRVHITCQITWDWTALQPLVSMCSPYDLHCYQFLHECFVF